ncbi:MAG: hypothetical protein RL653_1788 [Pseudomonadota bacterium]|jgi:competence protein ComEA
MSRGRITALAVAGAGLLGVGVAVSAWREAVPAGTDCDGGTPVLEPGRAGAPARWICHLGPDSGAGQLASEAVLLGRKLDLNRAPLEQLERLPGISPALARSLVTAREARPGGFQDWAEVDSLPGVGPATLERLQAVLDLKP